MCNLGTLGILQSWIPAAKLTQAADEDLNVWIRLTAWKKRNGLPVLTNHKLQLHDLASHLFHTLQTIISQLMQFRDPPLPARKFRNINIYKCLFFQPIFGHLHLLLFCTRKDAQKYSVFCRACVVLMTFICPESTEINVALPRCATGRLCGWSPIVLKGLRNNSRAEYVRTSCLLPYCRLAMVLSVFKMNTKNLFTKTKGDGVFVFLFCHFYQKPKILTRQGSKQMTCPSTSFHKTGLERAKM